METEEILRLSKEYIIPAYNRMPCVFVKGSGVRLWDADGKGYLDFVSGIAVNSIGHAHPKLIEAINEQSSRLLHTSNLYEIGPQVLLAKRLSDLSIGGKVFFCNSGAEANEAAIKLARLFGNGRYEIITMTGSFHGRTLATLAATGQRRYQNGFDPLPEGFRYAEFNDLGSVERTIGPLSCAVMVEVIQGEGGVRIAREEFVQGLRELCDENRLLLIIDEVQTGIGRTGKMFAYEGYGVIPDVITLAKGLGGGIPIGAMIAKREVADLFSPGRHASTFGGNPLSTRAALAVLDVIQDEDLVNKACELGGYLISKLEDLKKRHTFIKEVRGKGLMVGVELDFEGGGIVKRCLSKGLLINCTMDRVLRFLPPLVVKKEEIDEAIQILDEVLTDEEGSSFTS